MTAPMRKSVPMPASVPRDAAGGNGPRATGRTRCAYSDGNTTYHSVMGLSPAVMVGTAADVAEPAWPPADGSVPRQWRGSPRRPSCAGLTGSATVSARSSPQCGTRTGACPWSTGASAAPGALRGGRCRRGAAAGLRPDRVATWGHAATEIAPRGIQPPYPTIGGWLQNRSANGDRFLYGNTTATGRSSKHRSDG